jgi:plastocyanin
MKKILTHLTGIGFLIAILIAGGCSAEDKKVNIYCKAVNIDGALQFEMFDSNDGKKVIAKPSKEDPTKFVANDTTEVMPGTKVTWEWTSDSDIQEFLKIKPKKHGNIFKKDPEKDPETNKYKLRIPNDAPEPSPEEKYDIIFLDWNGNTVTIDPYLKIR